MCNFPYLTDVDASLVLIISSVADGQAKLVLDVGSVQIHLLDQDKLQAKGYTSLSLHLNCID